MDPPGLTPPGAAGAPGPGAPESAARRGPGGPQGGTQGGARGGSRSGSRSGPRILVLGNEKGGSGKSTTAAHLIVALLKRGFSVGSIDLDARQGTLSRLLENRADYAERSGLPLELPEHRRIYRSEAEARGAAESEEKRALETAVAELADRDYIVMTRRAATPSCRAPAMPAPRS